MAKRRKRRKPNTGYTTQATNKTWSAFFPKFGGGYHVRKGFDTRPAAEAWLDSLVAQSTAKVDVGKGQQQTGAWIDAWATRTAREHNWKVKMIADVEWKLGYVKPYLQDYALADVRPEHTDAMFDDLSSNLAETTIRQIRNYLYRVFKAAQDRHYITFNPVIRPERHKRAKQQPPERLNAAQAVLIIHAAESSFYGLAWWLVLVLGLRAGEVCGLRWGDLDLDLGVIHILQEVTDVRGKATKDTPKNDKQRHLPLPLALIPLFKLHKQAYMKRAKQGAQKGYWQENGLVFPGRGGKPMNPTSLRHQLHDLTDACALPPIKTHNLRHTAAKFYTDLGCPQHIVSAILGHTPNITGHYAPPDPDALRPFVEQVYRLLSGEVEKQRKTG